MEANEQNFAALASYLKKTADVNPQERKAAEETLNSLARQPGFSLLVLKFLELQQVDLPTKLAGAIFFKNFVKKYWAEDNVIPESDKEQIKAVIVNLMLSLPSQIQKQLAAALEYISECDFPDKWKNLLPELIKKFETKDFRIINGVLKTVHSILKRYRYHMKSTKVLEDLKYILEIFQEPLLQLYQAATSMIDQHASSPDVMVSLFTAIKLMSKIFYSLNAIDLPEYFEDHMNEWMTMFRKLLIFESNLPQLIGDEDSDTAGLLHKVQALICNNLNLYVGKYEEEFSPYYETFVKDIWTLLVKTPLEAKYDSLATAAIQFLSSACTSVHYQLFSQPEVLKMVCERIVIPNMKLREVDIELFEDNPTEYIRRDIEGSDTDTRRKIATELVKGLRKHFERETTEICASYITALLQQYSSDPMNNWIAKDVAMYLVTALTVKTGTEKMGTTAVNPLVPILEFFGQQVLPELENSNPPALVLKADALKFVTTFRQQLPKDAYTRLFPLFIANLGSNNLVVKTYAAACVDRLLTVRDNGQPRFTKADLKPLLADMLTALFKSLEDEQSKENEYIMRAITKVIGAAQEEILPYSGKCIQALVTILGKICKNPTNPTFNHYLFECIGAMTKSVSTQSKEALAAFEKLLIPPFQIILQADVQEFAAYVFQILALLLESTPSQTLNEFYIAILPPLLAPVLWERTGNIPALVRLVQAYLKRGAAQIVQGGQLPPILGIFQKLISSKMNDHEGFYILESIVEFLPLNAFEQYMPTVWSLIFTRLQKDKTLKFIKSFLVFLSLYVGKHGPSAVMKQVEAIQNGLFVLIFNSLWLPNVQKVNGLIERKMVAIASTKFLCECPEMLNEPYISIWGKLLAAEITVLEGAVDDTVPADVEDLEIEDTIGYSPGFSALATAMKQDVDPFPDVQPKPYLAVSLHQLSKQHPGKFGKLIESSLDANMMQFLGSYFKLANIPEPYIL